MAAQHRICEIADAVDDEYPCEEKMPLARHREPTIAGNSQPRRKAALSKLAVGAAGRAQPAGGDEFMAENSRLADDLVGIGRGRFDLKDRRTTRIRRFSPVQRGMSAEDVQAAHEQDRQRDHIDPVHDADRQRVTVIKIAAPPALRYRGFSLHDFKAPSNRSSMPET